LEEEANQEPRRVVYACGRGDFGDTSEDDRHGHVADPRFRVAALVYPERDREEDTRNDRVEMWVVYGTCAELTCRSDEAPKEDFFSKVTMI